LRNDRKESDKMRIPSRAWRRRGLLIAACAWLPIASCDAIDDLIRADNPAQIAEDELDDPALAGVLINSVIGQLSAMYDDPFIWIGSMLTDEQVTGINWEGTARVNERIVRFDGEPTQIFGWMSRYRFMGDSVASRLRTLLENPQSDRNMALALAHAGYGYNLMAEIMCEATLNVGPDIYTPLQLFQLAIPRFEEAVQIATAANAQDVLNLARTGLARAALNAGDKDKAMAAARDVPLAFNWWVEYLQGTITNTMHTRVTGANHALGVHPRFLNGPWLQTNIRTTQTDPRIQHNPNPRFGHNGRSPLYTPYASLPYSAFNGRTVAEGGTAAATAPGAYDQSMNIKLASGLEAMHHYYEAAGPNATGPRGTTLEFVNERRAFGNQEPVALSGEELMSELREQRARDMYLGGFRLGDLRRWERQGINDPRHAFPSGEHPVPGWTYRDATCFPLPIQEYVGNPNIRR
jgi:hypothetical protein